MPAAHAAWQRAVAGVLAKARKVDPSELPADPESLLASTTYDGVTIAPLYTALDELPEPALPGEFPFVRGRDPHRDVNRGWLVSARFDGDDPAAVNRAVLDALNNGVSAIWLRVGDGIGVADLPRVLDGVLLDLAPLTVEAGPATEAAARELFSLLDHRAGADGVGNRADIVVALGASPLTSAFAAAPDIDLAAAVELAAAAVERMETVRTFTVDATVFHNAGAADAQELGAAVAAGLDYLRALTDSGLSISAAMRQIEFRFAATDDQFLTIAKFRAARQLWARVAQVCGASEFGDAPQHAVTSAAMMTQRDPWVNMLRTTLAAFGAGIGGADVITVLPFDAALPAEARETSPTFAARIARNTQLLLLEESHLGRVVDPGAGSWHVETLTADLAESAWQFVQEIEASGGYTVALESGLIAERIAATRRQRESDVAHRKTAVTGVNEFPNIGEKPLAAGTALPGVARYAAAFEALRDRSDAHLSATGARPKILLVPLGPVAEHNVRATFAVNLLASGGIEHHNAGIFDPTTIGDVVREVGATTAVLCGSDPRYTTDGPEAVQALRSAGIDRVLVAGPEKVFAQATGTDRPDGFLTARIDAVAALSELLDYLGAK
ncbi:methylmalonyl-CoA mutase small subunit [Skermania sp. ID1734]|nr:methylmalonyl-CoA mutase small subunit [Skermania sp. ID1734]